MFGLSLPIWVAIGVVVGWHVPEPPWAKAAWAWVASKFHQS